MVLDLVPLGAGKSMLLILSWQCRRPFINLRGGVRSSYWRIRCTGVEAGLQDNEYTTWQLPIRHPESWISNAVWIKLGCGDSFHKGIKSPIIRGSVLWERTHQSLMQGQESNRWTKTSVDLKINPNRKLAFVLMCFRCFKGQSKSVSDHS